MKRILIFSLMLLTGAITICIEGASAQPVTQPVSIEDAVSNAAQTTGKAVVSISTERTEKVQGMRRYYFSPFGGQGQGDESFRRFFDDFLGSMPDQSFRQMGLGSGVIIDKDGLILTNAHVINDADKITVTLADGREFKGEVKGRDNRSDLAVLKINAHNLTAASLGDSSIIKIGQWVVAIGNPFGFAMENPEPTVTVGVVSALHRSLGRAEMGNKDYSDLIQTDAAINPGNSGGPLVNLRGEVIGINVAIFSTSGGYQGVGFAIPINRAKRIIDQLVSGKKIVYGWLGVTIQDLSEDMAAYFGLSDKNGALVANVLKDGPADKAGIKMGDCIRQFDNKPVINIQGLISAVSGQPVGSKVKIVVVRDKKEIPLEVLIGERPDDVNQESAETAEPEGWRGLEVADLTPDIIMRNRIEEKKGVVITGIEPNSPADESGLIKGEVILEIERQPIKNTADYQRATKAIKGDCLVRTSRGYFLVKGEKK